MRKLIIALSLLPTCANAYVKHTKEELCLAQNIYLEAGIESDLGKQAVAEVTLNRVNDRRWPDNTCDVVYQKDQFSWTRDPSLVVGYDSVWEDSLRIARQVMNGEDLLYIRANHYYAPKSMDRRGAVPKWAMNRLPDFHLEGHIFYFL